MTPTLSVQAPQTTPTTPVVLPGSFLTLHYRLSGPQGDIVSTFGEKPATLTLGTGELSPAVEQRVIGLHEGERAVFDIAAGEAFGPRNAEMLQWVPHSTLAKFGDPLDSYAVGDVVQFPVPGGRGSYAGALVQVKTDSAGESFLFDFNHPLAGQPVRFEVHVLGVL